MPHLSIPLDHTTGPILNVTVGVSDPRAAFAQRAGQLIPEPYRVPALVDTGASGTAISHAVIGQLGLMPTGSVEIATPSTGAGFHEAFAYDISLKLEAAEGPKRFGAWPAVGSNFEHQPFELLLGRDVLEYCLLVYDGVHQIMMLAF